MLSTKPLQGEFIFNTSVQPSHFQYFMPEKKKTAPATNERSL